MGNLLNVKDKESMSNAPSFDGFSEKYHETYGRKDTKFLEVKVSPYLPADAGRILDAGCGSGSTTLALSGDGRYVVGVDISHEMIKLARQNQADLENDRVDFLIADLEHLPFKKDSFDFVMSIVVLHHTDLNLSLPGLARIVMANGVILIRDLVINRPHLQGIWLWHVFLTLISVPYLIKRKGVRKAWRLLTFELSPSWIRHKVNQRLLSPTEFESNFSRLLPGCTFPEGPIGVALWQAF